MKKSEFKKLIKPIVKECIQESLLEEGLLASVISEVVRSMSVQPIVEQKQPQPAQKIESRLLEEETERRNKKIKETRRKMLDAAGAGSYNGVDLFEGTTPLKSGGAPGASAQPNGPLSGVGSNDAGVDISALMGNKRIWDSLMEGTK